jgi:hypothetical protein
VPVQRSHDTDPREHRWPVMLRNQQQCFHRGLPNSMACPAFSALAFQAVKRKQDSPNTGERARLWFSCNATKGSSAICRAFFGAVLFVARSVGISVIGL